MHWDRSKSTEHADKIIRHLIDRGKVDDKGKRHSVMVAWRALALLQEELEADLDLPLSRASQTGPEKGCSEKNPSDWDILYTTGKAPENAEHRERLLRDFGPLFAHVAEEVTDE